MACSDLISTTEMETAKLEAASFAEFVESTESTFVTPDGTTKKTVSGTIAEFNAQLASQVDTFQNRFALSDTPIAWSAGLLITDELQLYSTGTKGESGYSVWLPDPNQLPFTTSATFSEDEALNRWRVQKTITELQAVAITNNVAYDEVAYLQTGSVSGIKYFYDAISQTTYAVNGAVTGTIDSIGADVDGVVGIVVDGVAVAISNCSSATTFSPYVNKMSIGLDKVIASGDVNLITHGIVKNDNSTDNSPNLTALMTELYDLDSSVNLIIPAGGRILHSDVIIKPRYVSIVGASSRGSTLVKTTDNISIVSDSGEDYEGNYQIFCLSGQVDSEVSNLMLVGGTSNHTLDSIVTGKSVRFLDINKVNIKEVGTGFKSLGDLWMTELYRLHTTNAERHIDMGNSGFKTSLDIKGCWAENTGTGYIINNAQYSNMSSCGADRVGWGDKLGNPYGIGFGDAAQRIGVYNLANCLGFNIMGCGTEDSYGVGAVRVLATTGAIKGFRSINLSTDYDNASSGIGVGIITTTTELSKVEVGALSVEGGYDAPNITSGKVGLIGFNYNESAYGEKDYNMVTLNGDWDNEEDTIVGLGSKKYVKTESINDVLGERRKEYYPSIINSDVLTIPIVSQGSQWRTCSFEIVVTDAAANSTTSKGGRCAFNVSSLTSIAITGLEVSGDVSSVSASGMNINITLNSSRLWRVFIKLYDGNGGYRLVKL